jgi:hypothetical protein
MATSGAFESQRDPGPRAGLLAEGLAALPGEQLVPQDHVSEGEGGLAKSSQVKTRCQASMTASLHPPQCTVPGSRARW